MTCCRRETKIITVGSERLGLLRKPDCIITSLSSELEILVGEQQLPGDDTHRNSDRIKLAKALRNCVDRAFRTYYIGIRGCYGFLCNGKQHKGSHWYLV